MSDIQWLTRDDIGLIEANRLSVVRSLTTGIYFHHSGTARPSMPQSVDQSINQWKNIQWDHLRRIIFDKEGNPTYNPDGSFRRWADIAYNIGIGYRCVLDGRGAEFQGGGTGWPWDGYTISICILGNMTIEDITEDLEETIIFALRRIRETFSNDLEVNGDRDVNSTNCPGDNIYENIDYFWRESGLIVPTPIPDEDEDMGKPLHVVKPPAGQGFDYDAQFIRWDNGTLSHLGPGEITADVFKNLPVVVETDREAYFRLVRLSGTQWRPGDWPAGQP